MICSACPNTSDDTFTITIRETGRTVKRLLCSYCGHLAAIRPMTLWQIANLTFTITRRAKQLCANCDKLSVTTSEHEIKGKCPFTIKLCAKCAVTAKGKRCNGTVDDFMQRVLKHDDLWLLRLSKRIMTLVPERRFNVLTNLEHTIKENSYDADDR